MTQVERILRGQQKTALDKILRWAEDPKYTFLLAGFAGTGKTWLVKTVLEEIPELGFHNPMLLGPTGKSTRVLEHKTGMKAYTCHKAMYTPVKDEIAKIRKEMAAYVDNPESETYKLLEARLIELKKEDAKFTFKGGIEQEPDFLTCDEGSMVGERIAKDMESLKLPILVTFDPFQLQPVKMNPYWAAMKPHFLLTDIVRQQGDETIGIVNAATMVRQYRNFGPGPGMRIVRPKELTPKEYSKFDIILCGMNATRLKVNSYMRELYGFKGEVPHPGERVICLSNSEEYDISNGETFIVTKATRINRVVVKLDVKDNFGNTFEDLRCFVPLFNDEKVHAPFGLVQMTYGYAITVHKSQGSEWENVLLIDDWNNNKADYSNWLYTGLTRASKNCTYLPN